MGVAAAVVLGGRGIACIFQAGGDVAPVVSVQLFVIDGLFVGVIKSRRGSCRLGRDVGLSAADVEGFGIAVVIVIELVALAALDATAAVAVSA